jgi:hypothetical protein
LEGVDVDVDEAEGRAEAEFPLEAVEQRPYEVPADVGAILDGRGDRLEVSGEVGDAVVVGQPLLRWCLGSSARPFSVIQIGRRP